MTAETMIDALHKKKGWEQDWKCTKRTRCGSKEEVDDVDMMYYYSRRVYIRRASRLYTLHSFSVHEKC